MNRRMYEPRPLFVAAHNRRADEELLMRLAHPWDTPWLDATGAKVSVGQVRGYVRRRLANDLPLVLTLAPPRVEPLDTKRGGAPRYILVLSPHHSVQVAGSEADPVVLQFKVLRSNHARYAHLYPARDDPFNPDSEVDTQRFLEACRRVVEVLGASFAFGDLETKFVDDELTDPRSRAWAVTYFGQQILANLGSRQIEKAPSCSQIQKLDTGGVWLYLSPLPFTESQEKERCRHAVEKHFRLEEKFSRD